MTYFHLHPRSSAMSVLVNVASRPLLAYDIAREEDLIDGVVDTLQMFRDITPIFCLAAEVLARLIEANATVRKEVRVHM